MYFLQQFEPRHFRHFVIRDQQVITIIPKHVPANGSILGRVRNITAVNQGEIIQEAHISVVVNHEDAGTPPCRGLASKSAAGAIPKGFITSNLHDQK